MSEATSSGRKPRLDLFIPRKLKLKSTLSRLNANDAGSHADTAGQTTSPTSKPQRQNMQEAADLENSRNHKTSGVACLAEASLVNQPPDDVDDKVIPDDQLRLLYKTLTKKLQQADMRSEVISRADSGTGRCSDRSGSVSQLPSLPQPSGSVCRNGAVKTGIMIADTVTNDNTTSPNSASRSSPSQEAAADSTECSSVKSPCRSDRSPASDTSSTDSRHKPSITRTAERRHPNKKSDKPARSRRPRRQASPKSHRYPKQSRRKCSDHSFRRTGHSGRKHSKSPFKLKRTPAKRKRRGASTHQSPYTDSSPSSATGTRAATTVSQSPARRDRSAGWGHEGLGLGGVRPYSPPQRFNMGYTPGRRQSTDSVTKRPSRWSSPVSGRLASPHGARPSPSSSMASPHGGVASPSSSMPSPRGGCKERVLGRSPLHRSPEHQSHGLETESPGDLAQDHSLVGPPAVAYSGPLRDPSLSPMDRSDSPSRGQASHRGSSRKDTDRTSWQGDQLDTAWATANRPVLTANKPDSPVPAHTKHLNTDSPARENLSSTHGLVSDSPPARASSDIAHNADSRPAASCLSPSRLAKSALPHSPGQGSQQSLLHNAAHGAKARQSGLQHHNAVAKRKLNLSSGSHPDHGILPTDSSNTNTGSTTALPIDLTDAPTLADLHPVRPTALPMSAAHRPGVNIAATQRQGHTKSDKSLLKRVLHKSLAVQDGTSKGQSGPDIGQASGISSQDVHQPCAKTASDTQTLGAEAAESAKSKHLGHGDRTQTKRSRRTKRLELADANSDTPSDARSKFEADMAKHRSKRHRHSSGAAKQGGKVAALANAATTAAGGSPSNAIIVEPHGQYEGKDEKQRWVEALDRAGPLEFDAKCWFYLDPLGKARGVYSLHMFMSWLFNLEKGNHVHELAAFKEVTVWQANMTTRVPLVALVNHFEALYAAYLQSEEAPIASEHACYKVQIEGSTTTAG